MTDVTFPAAAAAGLLSFLSPCVLPLAPPYLCYLAGASLEELVEEGEARARRNTIVAALLFVLGFATVFVALGATASVFGALLRQWSHALSIAAGLGIMAMGQARADELYGKIRGTVTDASGAAVPGARVTVRNTGTGVSRSMDTLPTGDFEFLRSVEAR